VNRTGWLSVLALGLLGAGLLARQFWPDSAPALVCDAGDILWVDGGTLVAICAPGTPRGEVPAGAGRLLGVKFDLNAVSEEELGRVPGIGPQLAHTLVEGRAARSGFQSWEEVAGVRGVGPARLQRLQEVSEIGAIKPGRP
jgi:competence protein ComEA